MRAWGCETKPIPRGFPRPAAACVAELLLSQTVCFNRWKLYNERIAVDVPDTTVLADRGFPSARLNLRGDRMTVSGEMCPSVR